MLPLLDVVYEIEPGHWLSSGHTADLPSAENLAFVPGHPSWPSMSRNKVSGKAGQNPSSLWRASLSKNREIVGRMV
jgi:hypothetical protein